MMEFSGGLEVWECRDSIGQGWCSSRRQGHQSLVCLPREDTAKWQPFESQEKSPCCQLGLSSRPQNWLFKLYHDVVPHTYLLRQDTCFLWQGNSWLIPCTRTLKKLEVQILDISQVNMGKICDAYRNLNLLKKFRIRSDVLMWPNPTTYCSNISTDDKVSCQS